MLISKYCLYTNHDLDHSLKEKEDAFRKAFADRHIKYAVIWVSNRVAHENTFIPRVNHIDHNDITRIYVDPHQLCDHFDEIFGGNYGDA